MATIGSPTSAPPAPSPAPESTALWGRAAGASAAERAAELERERTAWATGSAGEQRVGAELDQLPAGSWWVFHDVPRGTKGTNVDHLVIGVGGVFSVKTKNVGRNVWVAERVLMVNGQKTDFLPVAVGEARDVGRRLGNALQATVTAHPLIVFLDPPTIRAMPSDVTVLEAAHVRNWLQRLPALLTPEQAYSIVLAANQPATWR